MSDVWVDNTGPRLLAAVPCEDTAASAALGDGRATLQRVFYDIYASDFPAGFDRLNVASIWMGGNGEYAVGARLSAPDGTVIAEAAMTYAARPEPGTAVLLMHFGGPAGAGGRPTVLVLPEPGRYAVDVLLNGVPISTLPIFALRAPAAGKPSSE